MQFWSKWVLWMKHLQKANDMATLEL
uniref:HEM6 n=1 Tax=Arundo donax TaxID=35708 RepID=A0A0A9HPN9_ARUDO